MRVSLMLIALLAFTASCSSNEGTGAKVRIGYLASAASLPLFVAVEQGYFKQEGIDAALQNFNSSNEMGAAAAAGQLDILSTFATNVAFDLQRAAGTPLRMFALNTYSATPPHVVDYMVVRPGVQATGLADLRGMRVAAFPGSVSRVFTLGALAKHGVQADDITFLELAPKDWEPALKSGSIDAAHVIEPQATQILSDEAGRVIADAVFAEMMPDPPVSGHWLTAELAQGENQTVAASIIRAYDRAIDFIREHPDQARALYVKYTGLRPEIASKVPLMKWAKASEINPNNLRTFIDLVQADQPPDKRSDAAALVYSF